MLCGDELLCSVTEFPTKKQQLQALNLLVLLLPEANRNTLKVAVILMSACSDNNFVLFVLLTLEVCVCRLWWSFFNT